MTAVTDRLDRIIDLLERIEAQEREERQRKADEDASIRQLRARMHSFRAPITDARAHTTRTHDL